MRFTVALFISFVLIAACGPTVTNTCSDYAKAYCDQQYKCQTGTALANLKTQYGDTADACALVFGNCAAAQSPCAVGTSYDTGQAETCVSTYAALTCDQIQTNYNPPECDPSKICH